MNYSKCFKQSNLYRIYYVSLVLNFCKQQALPGKPMKKLESFKPNNPFSQATHFAM